MNSSRRSFVSLIVATSIGGDETVNGLASGRQDRQDRQRAETPTGRGPAPEALRP